MKFKQVEEFMDFLVSLPSMYTVDDDGYVLNSKDENVSMKVGEDRLKLTVLRESGKTSNDTIVLNPLVEGIHDKDDTRWLYSALSIGLFIRTMNIINTVHSCKTDEAVSENLPAGLVEIISKFKTTTDAKFVNNITVFNDRPFEFINVYYDKRRKTAKLRCCVFEDDRKTKFPSLRVKDWKDLTKMMSTILDLNGDRDITYYSYKAKVITCPKLEALLNVYYKVYDVMGEFLELIVENCPEQDIDMTDFGHHINHLSEYYDKTKWISQTVSRSVEVSDPLKSRVDNIANVPDCTSTTVSTGIPTVMNDGTVIRATTPQPMNVSTVPTVDAYGNTIPTVTNPIMQPNQMQLQQQALQQQQLQQQALQQQTYNQQQMMPQVQHPFGFNSPQPAPGNAPPTVTF